MKNLFKTAALSIVVFAGANSFVAASINSATAADYYVVVNSANNFSGSEDEAKSLIRRVFLKSTKNWPGGETAVPFSRKDTNAAQVALLANILAMTEAEHGKHWARQKQTTGDTPPRAVGSKSILLRLIKREPGAIGVMDGSGPEPEGVKVLLKFSS